MSTKSSRRPRVFLSHSKKDRRLVETIAGDLRSAHVDVWYDDWEIPLGESLRDRIFSDGIEGSDLFFTYLTPNSLESRWCQSELDAGFVIDYERKGGCFAAFVSDDETRASLRTDLRALRIPVLNDQEYERPLRLLLSRAWSATLKDIARRAENDARLTILGLEKELAEQALVVERLRSTGAMELAPILSKLRDRTVTYKERSVDMASVLQHLAPSAAVGATGDHLLYLVRPLVGAPADTINARVVDAPKPRDVLGPLIILGLIDVRPPSGEWDELYYLTDLGKRVVMELDGFKRTR